MTLNLGRAVLVIVLSAALVAPARAETLQTAGDQVIAGVVVVSVGLGILVTYLIVHHKHSRTAITGCVKSGANGMSLTNEKDQRTYALTGDPVGIKPGNRMSLEGKRERSGQALVFQALTVTKDYGVCQP
jgi:hypothetical protein